MKRLPLLISALTIVGCGSERSEPAADDPQEVTSSAEGSSEPADAAPVIPADPVVAEVSPQPEAETVELPPVPAPPTATVLPPILPLTPAVVTPPPNYIDFAPIMETGDEVRRSLRWSSESRLTVEHNGREVHSSVNNAVEVTLRLVVTAEDKGSPEAVGVHFEEFTRTTSGEVSSVTGDPAAGDAWTCQLATEPVLCAVSPEVTIAPPDWLALSYRPILPARAMEPSEEWSRRVGVAPLVGAGSDATVRAVLSAGQAYETAEGTFSTARFEFDGEDVSQALGRTTPLSLTGTGAFEFDLRRRRLVGFDATWTGVADGERANGTRYARYTEASVRMVELVN